ncbi:hypothetical protein MMC13_002752 [Lambiella insularis]|nr:hypothetical protein [Lambiella insularis]
MWYGQGALERLTIDNSFLEDQLYLISVAAQKQSSAASMPTPPQITEIGVFHIQDGVNLEDVAFRSPNLAAQAFAQLTKTLKAQQGYIRQFWGPEVEHPHLFVWAIEWESLAHHTTFIASEEGTAFTAGLGQVFDLEAAAPVIPVFTRVANPEGATAAFRSGVTEVAFYTMPARPDDATRAEIDAAFGTTIRDVQAIGKASGAAIGWVFDGVPKAIVSGADSICLYGVFGYASIDVHLKWRETPEAKKAAATDEGMERRNLTFEPATVVPGLDPDTGYFHVKFREGT